MDGLCQMGLQPDNIVKWPLNGIEYYYPPAVLDRIYGAGPPLVIEGDQVSRNGLTYSKNDLAEKVCGLIDAATPMHSEFEGLFVGKIGAKVS